MKPTNFKRSYLSTVKDYGNSPFFLGMISWGEAILRMAVVKSIIKPTKKTKIFVGRFTLWENH